jgi:hypothetical protein
MRENVIGRVPSLSDPKVSYQITARLLPGPGAAEELRCGCQAFGSWKKRGLPCWHLRVWESAQKALAKCYELHGGDGGDRQQLCGPCLLSLLAALAAKVKNDYVPRPPKKVRTPKPRLCACRHPDSTHMLAATTRGLSCCSEPGCDCREFTPKPKRTRKAKALPVPA